MATTKTLSLPELAAAYAVANDPRQVREILVANGIIANITAANSLSDKQLVQTLISYYNSNGAAAYGNLLRQFTPNPNTKNWTTDPNNTNAIVNDLQKIPAAASAIAQAQSGIQVQDFSCSWCKSLWTGIVGGSETVTPPSVTNTTVTTASPIVVAYVLAAVALVGILAWVFFIRK